MSGRRGKKRSHEEATQDERKDPVTTRSGRKKKGGNLLAGLTAHIFAIIFGYLEDKKMSYTTIAECPEWDRSTYRFHSTLRLTRVCRQFRDMIQQMSASQLQLGCHDSCVGLLSPWAKERIHHVHVLGAWFDWMFLQLKNLRSMDLFLDMGMSIDTLFLHSGFSQLNTLRISGSNSMALDFAKMCPCPEMTEVTVQGCIVLLPSLKTAFPRLRVLSFVHTAIDPQTRVVIDMPLDKFVFTHGSIWHSFLEVTPEGRLTEIDMQGSDAFHTMSTSPIPVQRCIANNYNRRHLGNLSIKTLVAFASYLQWKEWLYNREEQCEKIEIVMPPRDRHDWPRHPLPHLCFDRVELSLTQVDWIRKNVTVQVGSRRGFPAPTKCFLDVDVGMVNDDGISPPSCSVTFAIPEQVIGESLVDDDEDK
jgi:hypothetical protein